MSGAQARHEREARDAIVRWRGDPVLYVRQVFGVEPDAWQAEALAAVVTEERVALSACAGPGKSAVLSWIGWWWLDTRPDAQGLAASVTRENLRDGLWKELGLWYSRAPHLRAAFELQNERLVHRERPQTWWLSARGWPKDADPTAQASALGGFHTQFPLILLDEAGTLPDAVMVTAERIFATRSSEARLVVAWNPETTDGAAYRISTRDRRRWRIIPVTGDPDDPKRSPRVSAAWARQQIEDWGYDNDWVRVNVRGLFPLRGLDVLLGPDDISRAQARDVPPKALLNEASVWGLDVARSPTGDRSVLRERCGRVAFRPFVWRGKDGPTLAQAVSHILAGAKRKPEYLVVDAAGEGRSAWDHLRALGWQTIMVEGNFAAEADDSARYLDKSAELHDRLAKWVIKAGCLPLDSGVLAGELTTRKFSYRVRGKRVGFGVESKDDMKARGLPSPDEADALALTFYRDPWPQRAWLDQAEAMGARRGGRAKHEKVWGEQR